MSDIQNFMNKDIIFGETKKKSDMISVCSGAYGTGKTFISLTLAHAFSILKKKTLFFDADWGKYNISSYLGIKEQKNLSDVAYRNLTLNQIISHCEKTGFDILSGNQEYMPFSSLPEGRLQLLFDDLSIISKNYDKVILDISSEKQKYSNLIAGASSTNILIISPNPQRLVEGYNFIKTIKEQYPTNTLYIIINQVNSEREGNMIFETLKKTASRHLEYEPKLIGIVRNDTRIRDCQKNQALLLSRYPTSDAAVDIFNIAKKLVYEE